MKNTLKKILVILAAALMLVSLVSCGNKADGIKKAFEKDGWTVETVNTENKVVNGLLSAILSNEQMEDIADYELIYCNKNYVNNAVIIKFPSAGDVKDFLTVEDSEGNKNTDLYDAANEAGKINGNCYLVVGGDDAKELFK